CRRRRHQAGEDLETLLESLREDFPDLLRLPREVRAERCDGATLPERISMARRQVAVDDALEGATLVGSAGALHPQRVRLVQDQAQGLPDDCLLRSELAVEGTVREAGGLRDGIDAGAVDPVFPEEPRCRGQDPPAILGRRLLGYTHEIVLRRP